MTHILKQEREAERQKQLAAQTMTKPKHKNILTVGQSKLGHGKFRVPLSAAERERRENELILLYFKWDMDGSGLVDFEEMRRATDTFKLPDPKQTQDLQEQFKAAKEDGRFQNGVDRPSFLTSFMEIFRDKTADEFNRFTHHAHEIIEFVDGLTEEGRKKQAVFEVFVEFPKRGGGKIGFSELESVIKNTQFYYMNNINVRILLDAVLDYHVPEHPAEFAEFVALARETCLLDLQDFHKFVGNMVMDKPEDKFYDFIQQMKRVIEYEKKDHVISKYLQTGLDKVFDVGSIETQESSEVEKTDFGSLVLAALKDQDRNEELKVMRAKKLRMEMKHAFDAINVKDIEQMMGTRFPPRPHESVAAAVCALFKLSPKEDVSDYPYLESLKETISKNFKGFIRALTDFNTTTITEVQLRRVMKFHFEPDFEPNRLVMSSWLMSALCSWVKMVVQLTCLENNWVYPPPMSETDGHPVFAAVSLEKLTNLPPESETPTSLAALPPKALRPLSPATFSPSPPSSPTPRSPSSARSMVTSPTPPGHVIHSVQHKKPPPRLPILDNVFSREGPGSPRKLVATGQPPTNLVPNSPHYINSAKARPTSARSPRPTGSLFQGPISPKTPPKSTTWSSY
eukprot:TRINITY_DN54766_c0_g1_i1.p1 TRINITY_DN54766_c0_g1~~TRINITY_DN54766_c0_g1_i1.p1  ORF type:complete len:625 (+),score=52.30 TRINITY_DN54766_c0_g1_i1:87-1961(+)